MRKSSIVSTGTIEMAAFSLANMGSLILLTLRGVGHFKNQHPGPLNIFAHEAADHLPSNASKRNRTQPTRYLSR
jgi:hypothetical protein